MALTTAGVADVVDERAESPVAPPPSRSRRAGRPPGGRGPSLRSRLADVGMVPKAATVVVLLVIVSAAASLDSANRFQDLDRRTQAIYQDNVLVLSRLGELRDGLGDVRVALAEIAAAAPADAGPETAARLTDGRTAVDDALEDIVTRVTRGGEPLPAVDGALVRRVDGIAAARGGDSDAATLEADERAAVALFAETWRSYRAGADSELVERLETSLHATDVSVRDRAARDIEQAGDVARRGRLTLLLGLLGLALVAGGGASLVILPILQALRRINGAFARMAAGDFTARTNLTSRDELGRTGRGLDEANAGMAALVRQVAEASADIATSSQQLSAVNGQIATNAEESAAQAASVAAAAEEVSRNVTSVSAGAEELSQTLRQIAGDVSDAAQNANEAVSVSSSTNERVASFDESSAKIGDIVRTISAIAQQTNLLALNAAIEAARAGEHGRGFAVVANEVKDLAGETARATDDVTRRVQSLQSDTREAVLAIGEVADIIGRVNDYQANVANAVEQQASTTQEMSRGVSEAAAGTREIAQNISGVATAAASTRSGVDEARQAADHLAEISARLSGLVVAFHY